MTNQSGTSELPSLLSYPTPIKLEEFEGIKDIFCYIVKHYGYDGISCLISRSQDGVTVVVGDWKGNKTDLEANCSATIIAQNFLAKHLEDFILLLKTLQIKQVILYFVLKSEKDFILVDARISLNKFAGPGFVKDIFGKLVETQEIIKVAILDDKIFNAVKDGTGSFSGDLILKPSRFRCINVNKEPSPLYIEVLR